MGALPVVSGDKPAANSVIDGNRTKKKLIACGKPLLQNFLHRDNKFVAGESVAVKDNKKKQMRKTKPEDNNCTGSAHHLPSPLRLQGKIEEYRKPSSHECFNTSISKTTNHSCCLCGPDSRYELLEVLGKGAFSKVYQIQERKSMRSYALKMICKNPNGLNQRQLSAGCYETEIRILQNCGSHPNIITLHQVMYSTTHVFMIQELAAGGDLFDRLKKHSHFSEDHSKRTLGMILNGVSYLHSNGITHRDLKLENLLYKSQDLNSNILISDFGLAHEATRANACKRCDHHQNLSNHWDGCGMSTTCGTAEYLSPEMLKGEDYCQKVDTWAVGVIMYIIMCGKMPFSEEEGGGRGRARMYRKIRDGDYSLEDEVSCCKDDGWESLVEFEWESWVRFGWESLVGEFGGVWVGELGGMDRANVSKHRIITHLT